jgi:hypothetical protein
MTLLGKIFTVSILVASLFLMFVAMVVYATHTNWQQAYQTINTQLTTAKNDAAANEARYLDQISKLTAEQEAAKQEVRKLETQHQLDLTDKVTLQKQVDELQSQQRATAALVASTEENNVNLTKEVAELRASLRSNQEARDLAFKQTLRATTDLHVAAGDLQTTKERNSQLVDQVADLSLRLKEGGVSPDGEVVTRVRGLVSATRRADGAQLIEITIGADDGVRPGQTVEIFRGERYLGRAEVLKADPDRAVARVMREFQQGQIQEGDDVATKLRVG